MGGSGGLVGLVLLSAVILNELSVVSVGSSCFLFHNCVLNADLYCCTLSLS